MSKTKKYKYFRKNRRGKNGKNGKNSKHKTRRVQRGGQEHKGSTAVLPNTGDFVGTGTAALTTNRVFSGKTLQLGRTPQQMEEDRKNRIKAQNEQRQAEMEQSRLDKIDHEAVLAALAAQRAAKSSPPPSPQTQETSQLGDFKQPQSMGFGFGGDPVVTQQVAPSPQSQETIGTEAKTIEPINASPAAAPVSAVAQQQAVTSPASPASPGAEPVSAVAQQAAESSLPSQSGAETTGAAQQTYGNENFNTPPYMMGPMGPMGPMGTGLGYPSQIGSPQSSVVPAATVTKGPSPSITSTSIKPDPNSEEKIAVLSKEADLINDHKKVPMSPFARSLYERFKARLAGFAPGDENSIQRELGAEDQSRLAVINPMVNATFEREIKNAILLHKITNDELNFLTLELEKINQTIKQNINNEVKTQELKIKKDSITAEIAKVTSEMNALRIVIDSIRTTMGAPTYVNPQALVNPYYGSTSTGQVNSTSEKKPGFFSKVKDMFTRKKNKYKKLDDDPGNGGVPADTNKKQGIFSSLFTRKKNKVAPENAEAKLAEGKLAETTPETTPAGETHTEGTQAVETPAGETLLETHIRDRNEQDALLLKRGAKRVQNGLIPRFTRGVTSAKNAVKEGFSNAKKSVKRGFTNLKQKFSKDTTGETQPLLGDNIRSDGTAAQKTTWREKLTIDNMKKSASERVESLRRTAKNVKEAATSAMNRITRKKNKVSPTPENIGLLSGEGNEEGNEVEMQTVQSQQPEAPRKAPPPLPPPRPTSSSLSDSVSSQASEPETPRVGPPVPPRPDSFSALSQQSTVDKSDPTDVNDVELPSKIQPPAPRVPPPVPPRPNSFAAPSSQNSTVKKYDDWDEDDDDDKPKKPKLKVVIKRIEDTSQTPSQSSPIQDFAPPPTGATRKRSPRPPSLTELSDKPTELSDNNQEYPDLIKLGGGGNKTRKNRQYIHEIKENRTHLFNKEMQILNSIRNFKNVQHHGPNERGKNKPENIQKKFIKVIKRS